MITNFEEFMKINEDDGGGCAMATNGGGGMGAITSPTISSSVGDVAGSTPGSGDVANGGFGPYGKGSLGSRKRRKKIKK